VNERQALTQPQEREPAFRSTKDDYAIVRFLSKEPMRDRERLQEVINQAQARQKKRTNFPVEVDARLVWSGTTGGKMNDG